MILLSFATIALFRMNINSKIMKIKLGGIENVCTFVASKQTKISYGKNN